MRIFLKSNTFNGSNPWALLNQDVKRQKELLFNEYVAWDDLSAVDGGWLPLQGQESSSLK